MSIEVPNRISVTVKSTFQQMFMASLTMIRYHGALIVVHLIFPLAGLFLLVFPPLVGLRVGPQEVILAMLGFSFTPLLIAVSVWSARRQNKLTEGSFVYSFDSDGVHTSGATFDQTIKWSAIPRVRQSKRFLFIFISRTRALCIPMIDLVNQGVFKDVRAITELHTDFQ
ncbi:MAG: YcxB family protein [Verrucomicrobiota bacterium]